MPSILIIHVCVHPLPQRSTLDTQQKVCQLELKDDFF